MAAAAVIVMIVGAAGCAMGAGESTATRTPPPVNPNAADIGSSSPEIEATRPLSTPTRTVEESGGFRLAALSSSACTAEAPSGWTMQAAAKSDRSDVMSLDRVMYAGYGIQAVNTALRDWAVAYDPPLNDRDLYSDDPATVAMAYGRIIVASLGGSPDLHFGDELSQPGSAYRLQSVRSSTHQGVIFFRTYGFPGDGYNYSYALPMYFAFTTNERWQSDGLLVARVAASIRCSTQLQPRDEPGPLDPAQGGGNGDEPGYNPQLGTEYANDPTTGENYLVDPSTNWSDTGPQGPGYYVPKGGGDYQMLEPGRAD